MKNNKVGSGRIPYRNVSYLFLLFGIILSACETGSKSANENVQSRLSNKELKYFSHGKQLYTQYCSNCHMENGEGLGTLIPPLKGADYLLDSVAQMARAIKYGIRGPITVNNIEYNQPMPANPDMTSLEIMELLIYISNAWGNESKPVGLQEVEDITGSK